jgi:acyl-CoA synthetase (AMP-forming)/AMP-acid ligase II
MTATPFYDVPGLGAEIAGADAVGVAFIVPKEGETLVPDEVIAWARAHMANYKAPRRLELLDELPVNAAGKVDKVALRARVAG